MQNSKSIQDMEILDITAKLYSQMFLRIYKWSNYAITFKLTWEITKFVQLLQIVVIHYD